ncbi:hypothetical protein F0562_006608 [Nyssa sinensis]|uniref:PABC domain-containing protein n=1 Tax=Nyssa sinensis TaxID=561372 RepID=A0A5J5AKW1_9ASTE|nr:hypothetical protein F0562_006608 [Nyssa sinensis]
MLPGPWDMGGMPFRDAGISQPMSNGALASALANAIPWRPEDIAGENLYPLVEQLETGMLLAKDQTEVLCMLESPEANLSCRNYGGAGECWSETAAEQPERPIGLIVTQLQAPLLSFTCVCLHSEIFN